MFSVQSARETMPEVFASAPIRALPMTRAFLRSGPCAADAGFHDHALRPRQRLRRDAGCVRFRGYLVALEV